MAKSKTDFKHFKPLFDNVLIRPLSEESTTPSGIVLPDSAKEKPQKGKVISVSEVDEKGNKPAVHVGDVVLYGKYAGTEIKLNDKEYLVLREEDIIAIMA